MSNDRPPDELTGKVLGQFEIQEEIGRGGMASVYRGLQKSMGRTVAIKVLPRSLMHDPTFYERFEREVEVISKLEHPHILPIYDYGESDGMPYIAMRYLGGGSLEERLARSVLNPEEMERPLQQIGQALDYAHQQGIIHRDLKPGNIMLDESGNAYLSDFGIARVLGSNLTGSMIVGTPAYMSPEQANGMAVDGRTDIYSLGVMMFHLLTGHRPFQAETPMAVLLKHINEPMPSLAEFRGDVPDSIDAVLHKATAKEPNDRYSSATGMYEAYRDALRGLVTEVEKPTEVQPHPPPAVVPDVSPTPSDVAREAPTDLLKAEKRGLPVGLLTGALVVVIVAVVAIVFLMSQGSEDEPPAIVDAIPTAFDQAEMVEQDLYTISMPVGWESRQELDDMPENASLRHTWLDEETDTFVSLTILNYGISNDQARFRNLVNAYTATHYNPLSILESISEPLEQATAEDGSIHQGYWVDAPDEGEENPVTGEAMQQPSGGHLDVFYLNRAPYLVVVEMYTSDLSGNDQIIDLQSILDSLRIKTSSENSAS